MTTMFKVTYTETTGYVGTELSATTVVEADEYRMGGALFPTDPTVALFYKNTGDPATATRTLVATFTRVVAVVAQPTKPQVVLPSRWDWAPAVLEQLDEAIAASRVELKPDHDGVAVRPVTPPESDPPEMAALVMPFVVCQSNGGPYDDVAFVAGARWGQDHHTVKTENPDEWSAYVYPEMVPQYDLLAMDQGYTMTTEPWAEHPDVWVLVTFRKPGVQP